MTEQLELQRPPARQAIASGVRQPQTGLRRACLLAPLFVLAACGGGPDVREPGPSSASSSLQTTWGTVPEPSLPATVCARLSAALTPAGRSLDTADADPSRSQPDTGRIQSAIDACPSGQAVQLVSDGSASAFLSGPLRLASGVRLWIDRGVTLFASRNPADYDNGSGACGTATPTDLRACKPFITANATQGSGIVGDGAIDGRGGSLLTSGPNAGKRSWWDVAFQNKTQGLSQQVPQLLKISGGGNFTLYRIALLNSPNFHIVTSGVDGITAWGIKLLTPSLAYSRPGYACPPGSTPDKSTPATCFTPDTAKNTDGFDPGNSRRVLLAHSYISVGDDHVAVKLHNGPQSTDLAFLHNHFYYGHGLSIGSETDAGLDGMLVDDLAIDGHDSPVGNGLRIKSDASRGGVVRNVTYRNVCMRGVRNPLLFDSFYTANPGTRYPSFTGITLQNVHNLGSSAYGSGYLTFTGYDLNGQHNPLEIALDNVVFDGEAPRFNATRNGGPATNPAAAHFRIGPGAVSFAPQLAPSSAQDVTVEGNSGNSTPFDCTSAFVPLHSVLTDSPI